MDSETARQKLVENLAKIPEKTEKQLEMLFANSHFGDVVTEVFPEILNPHNSHGRELLEKYSEVAKFLEETKESEDATFVAVRAETRNAEYDRRNPKQVIEALSVRFYTGLRANDFEVVRDDQERAIGVAIARPSSTLATGWTEDKIKGTLPYAIVDTTSRSLSWSRKMSELQSPGVFAYGKTDNEVYFRVSQIDESLGLSLQPIAGVVLDMQGDAIRARAGIPLQEYLPIEQEK